MKFPNILIIALLCITAGLYADPTFRYKTNFVPGDVVAVLSEGSSKLHTLELLNGRNKIVSSNIFFPVDTFLFKGYAALVGLDSTLTPGQYTLLVRDRDGDILNTGKITLHKKIFKKENIPLNSNNSALRTDTDPEIVKEAEKIHRIYRTSDFMTVKSLQVIQLPVKNGIITSWYGDRRNFQYTDGTSSKSIHTGMDFAAAFGTRIHAAARGRVVFAGQRIMTGNSVVIEYLPGIYGVFFHMNELFVSTGDTVNPDTIIGSLGSSGLATGPHLHWELRVGSVAVNPEPLLAGGLIDKSLILSIVRNHTAE